MTVLARGGQRLESERRSLGEHLKSSAKEFQMLQPVNQLHWDSNASMQTQVAWRINEELEMCACLQGYDLIGITRCDGMTPKTRVLNGGIQIL